MSMSAPAPLPHRLGARLRDGGMDVVVAASQATQVQVCLLDPAPGAQNGHQRWIERRFTLHSGEDGLWHGHVRAVAPGQRYGFRVHGPWNPDAGLLHNPAKLLVDPYARGIVGTAALRPEVYGHVVEGEPGAYRHDLRRADDRDSAPFVPHGVALNPAIGLETQRPWTPWARTVIYEAHVRGLTLRHPGIPEELRGTYAGLAHPITIDHLKRLGVTAVELLPIQAISTEASIAARGFTNYWGYSTLGYFAPEPRYATAAARAAGPHAVLAEVIGMVSLLHQAGIEVILDVVYNHTCEEGADGPMLSWRGLDNTGYYLHDGGSPARYADVTGTGNSLDFRRSRVVQMTLDSLRYWADVVGVDGFRFDLAVTLGRRAGEFDPDHPFLVALAADPSLAPLKLIAEPWDIGPSGWRTGQFRWPMREWNDRFRDAARTFWLSDAAALSHGHLAHDMRELATRIAGSADLFGAGGPGARGPMSSVNFVTAHDGFTMADLVSYDHKHNAANGEGNRDGSDNNRSWNHGVEGPVESDSPGSEILPLRRRSIRNLLGTLLISTGTPMITAGDEFGRTQQGNNNAYCQDSEISWADWSLAPWQLDLQATARHLLALRTSQPALRPRVFAQGRRHDGDELADLAWFTAQGTPMEHANWHNPGERVMQMRRSGFGLGSCGPHGSPFAAADVLVIVNGSLDQIDVTLAPGRGLGWDLVWDSSWESPDEVRSAAVASVLHADSGELTPVDPLSMRIYTAEPPA